MTPAVVAGEGGGGGAERSSHSLVPSPWPQHPLSSAQSDRGEYRTEDGLVKGHAYSVTGTYKVSIPRERATGVPRRHRPRMMLSSGVPGLHQGAAAAAAEPMGPRGVDRGLERQVGWIRGGWGARTRLPSPHTPVSLAAHAGTRSPPSAETPCWSKRRTASSGEEPSPALPLDQRQDNGAQGGGEACSKGHGTRSRGRVLTARNCPYGGNFGVGFYLGESRKNSQ